MIWFTSDLHLGHANILRHCPERPWETVDAMDRGLIANLNARVMPMDDLYVLGDFTAYGTKLEDVRRYRGRIRCRHVFLVRGNHDKRFQETGLDSPFDWERDYFELRDAEGKTVLFHYPIEVPSWRGSRHGSYMLHGHIHSVGPAYNERQRAQGVRRMDVGVDSHNMFPVSMREVVAFFEGVEVRQADHHPSAKVGPSMR